MEDQERQENQDDGFVDIGEPLLQWEVDEFPRHKRSRTWYIAAVVGGVALIVYAIATANFLFAVIILMAGIIMLIATFKEPERVPIYITSTGILIDDMYYDYDAVKDFAIVYDPPMVSILYVDFVSQWQPMLSIPLEEMDPNEVRESLHVFCTENLARNEERLTDMARRLYKL